MEKIITRSQERGTADHGWLKANFSFSFAAHYDPLRVHFGALRVLNDDIIQPSKGFGTHPHDNMEIITIPLAGALNHKDSTGGEGIIRKGDIQVMSAGSGVKHSEFNGSDTDHANVLQTWIFPKKKDIDPRYDQRSFDLEKSKNNWQVLVSPVDLDDAMWINQDARISLTQLEKGKSISYKPAFEGNGVYLFLIEGEINVAGEKLKKRDAIGISDFDELSIETNEDSEILAIEVPMTW